MQAADYCPKEVIAAADTQLPETNYVQLAAIEVEDTTALLHSYLEDKFDMR